ncbi:MAG: ABC transporter permease [Firmicutes bacterium]|nr:ABC transporter permease [Bacillota bacterium]
MNKYLARNLLKDNCLPGQFNIFSLTRRDGNLRRLLLITVIIFISMSVLSPKLFLTLRNFTSMSFQFPELGILAMAMMVTMLTGGIDLSAVGIANLSGIIAALILTSDSVTGAFGNSAIATIILLAIIVSAIMGVVCGLLNGLCISKIGITPILATLGSMQIFTGIAIVITRGSAIYGFPDQFSFVGNGNIWIFPMPLIIFVILSALFAIMLNKTTFGRKLYMMGSNPVAAVFSGINNTQMLIRTYILSGFLSAMAGIVMIARTNSAKADYGTSYVLQAILVVVLGGVNPSGGFGTVSGLVLAMLCLQFLSSGFNMLHFSNFFKEFVWGAVLVAVMVLNYYSNTGRSSFRRITKGLK